MGGDRAPAARKLGSRHSPVTTTIRRAFSEFRQSAPSTEAQGEGFPGELFWSEPFAEPFTSTLRLVQIHLFALLTKLEQILKIVEERDGHIPTLRTPSTSSPSIS
jgi:hypothetical protein